jgi:hypothetical protein
MDCFYFAGVYEMPSANGRSPFQLRAPGQHIGSRLPRAESLLDGVLGGEEEKVAATDTGAEPLAAAL